MIRTTDAPAPTLTGALRPGRSRALGRMLQVAAAVYQGVALMAFIASLFLAAGWLKSPFMGAFFEQTLVFNGAVPSGEPETWDLYNQGVRFGDRLVAVNDVPVR